MKKISKKKQKPRANAWTNYKKVKAPNGLYYWVRKKTNNPYLQWV